MFRIHATDKISFETNAPQTSAGLKNHTRTMDDIRVTYEYIRVHTVTYECHNSTYGYMRVTYEYIKFKIYYFIVREGCARTICIKKRKCELFIPTTKTRVTKHIVTKSQHALFFSYFSVNLIQQEATKAFGRIFVS